MAKGWPLWTSSKGILDKTGGTTPEDRDPIQKCETILTLPLNEKKIDFKFNLTEHSNK